MTRILSTLGVAVVLWTAATLSIHAQSFVGPRLTYAISTGLGTDVSSYGAPVRFGIGGMYSTRISAKAELSAWGLFRIDNGGFLTPFATAQTAQSVGNGRLDVVDPVGGGPQVTTTIDISSVEAGIQLGFDVAKLDSAGSAIAINLGVGGDYILSATQTDDYSNVPKNDLGQRPVEETFTFESQVGFIATFGASITLPLGGDRIVIDLGYMARVPTELTYEGSGKEAGLGWLVGRGIRIGMAYQLGL